jgi:signal recognition particle receptor subunit beta
MVFFNYALRKLNAKIVFYGPGLCGKTTNLQWIHDNFDSGQRGKMISLATEGDRTIFFDLLPLDIGSIRGMQVTLQLYTVPGQVHYNSTRQLVLKGADGVVFVADSQRAMMKSNVDSLRNLEENLQLQGIELRNFPFCLQFNKRDLSDLLSIEELDASLNEEYRVPFFEGVATKGIGVQETLEGIVKLVMRNLRQRYEPGKGKRSFASPSAAAAPEPEPESEVPVVPAEPEPVAPAPSAPPGPVEPEMPAAAAPPAADMGAVDFSAGTVDEPATDTFEMSEAGEIDFGAPSEPDTNDVGVFGGDLVDSEFDDFDVEEPTAIHGTADYSTEVTTDETADFDTILDDDATDADDPNMSMGDIGGISFDDDSFEDDSFDEDEIEVIELPEEIEDSPAEPAASPFEIEPEEEAMDLVMDAKTGPVMPPPGATMPASGDDQFVVDLEAPGEAAAPAPIGDQPDLVDTGDDFDLVGGDGFEIDEPEVDFDAGGFDVEEPAEVDFDSGGFEVEEPAAIDFDSGGFEVEEPAEVDFDSGGSAEKEPAVDFGGDGFEIEEPAVDFGGGFEIGGSEPEAPVAAIDAGEPAADFDLAVDDFGAVESGEGTGLEEPVSDFGIVDVPAPTVEPGIEEPGFDEVIEFDEIEAPEDTADFTGSPIAEPKAPVEVAPAADEMPVLDADDDFSDEAFADVDSEIMAPAAEPIAADEQVAFEAPAEPAAAAPGADPFTVDDSDPFADPFTGGQSEPAAELAPEVAPAEAVAPAPEPAKATIPEVELPQPAAPQATVEASEATLVSEPAPQAEVISAEVVPSASIGPMVPKIRASEVSAQDNQLQLRLEGTGAIAESGQVRALDLIVPVPGTWVGNRRVTLQLRLTLEPTEESDAG